MVIVLIRTKVRADADIPAYEALNTQMYELVQTLPGFVSANEYTSADGDVVSMVTFESLETLRGWREHPDHLVAQHRGRTEMYASYRVEVCEVVRAYDFTSPSV